jgi:hypothetical protein
MILVALVIYRLGMAKKWHLLRLQLELLIIGLFMLAV